MAALAARPPPVILLLGSAGSGKSSFIKSVYTGPDVNSIKLNHDGQMPCTTKCKPYAVNLLIKSQNRHQAFILIDTPGFVNEAERDLRTLDDIATTLIDMRQAVCGVVCFYDITYLRASGTSLSDISLFKLICGKSFFPHIACVTTMWDKIRQQQKYEAVHNTLGQGPLSFQGALIFKRMKDNDECARVVLMHFHDHAASRPAPPKLQIVRELEDRWRQDGKGVSARASSAGRKISKKTAESALEYERAGRGCCAVM